MASKRGVRTRAAAKKPVPIVADAKITDYFAVKKSSRPPLVKRFKLDDVVQTEADDAAAAEKIKSLYNNNDDIKLKVNTAAMLCICMCTPKMLCYTNM